MSTIKSELDISQKAAVEIDKNAVVSAGAGSGKTRVLAERFTYLVLNKKIKVDEILTLTFTKKATSEMYSRIYKTLKANGADVSDFHKAHIQTLDSYCASVAKVGAHFYGITPDFTEDDDAITTRVQKMALPFILKHRDNEAIKTLVNTKDFNEIAQTLFVEPILSLSTIAEPIDFNKTLELQKEEIKVAWHNNSKLANDYILNIISLLSEYEGNKGTKFIQSLNAIVNSIEYIDIPKITDDNFDKTDTSELEKFFLLINQFAELKLPGGKANDIVIELKDIVKLIRICINNLISIINYIYGFKITKEVFNLLETFQKLVNDTKRSLGIITYSDVASIALSTLLKHPEIRAIEKKKYKAIMIDEFQDNNLKQRDMLFLLAENIARTEKTIPSVEELCKDKLFFVGDEKQSIYRFRGADVSVFRNLSNDFSDGNLALKTNYRSKPSLIASFNSIFGGENFLSSINNTLDNQSGNLPAVFFTEHNKDIEKDYEAIYHHVEIPTSKLSDIDLEKKRKRIHIALYDENTEAASDMLVKNEAEAIWVAKKIKELTTGENAEYKASDIAILFRKYSSQSVFERALLNEGIPYNTETLTGFFNDGPTNDLFSFLRLCAYPTDTMSYAQILRSPFVNLSINELTSILTQQGEPFVLPKINNFSSESVKRFDTAKKLYDELCNDSKTKPLTYLVSKLWYEAGYRYETLWNKKVSMYETLYDRIFALACDADNAPLSLAEFVDSVRGYSDEKEKLSDMDIPMEQIDGVHILTIHKSKGLEFPVVFVCEINKKGKDERNEKPLYCSKKYGISVNTTHPTFQNTSNYFFNLAKEENANMEVAELRRLAYVAMTRAEKELYITGTYKSFDGECTFKDANLFLPNGDKKAKSILILLSPILDYYSNAEDNIKPFTFETILPDQYSHSNTNRANTIAEKNIFIKETSDKYESTNIEQTETCEKIYSLPSQLHIEDDETNINEFNLFKDAPYQEINKIIFESISSKEKSADINLARFSFANFGTIAHAYMEAAITNNEVIISNKDIAGLDGSEKKLNIIKKVCSDMQNKFKLSKLGNDAVKSNWHRAEYAFKSRASNKIIKGVIDLVFQNSDNTFTIVDYKTNQIINPQIYYLQLACYRQAISQMFNVSESKIFCILYFLRFGKAIDITDECAKINIENALKIIY